MDQGFYHREWSRIGLPWVSGQYGGKMRQKFIGFVGTLAVLAGCSGGGGGANPAVSMNAAPSNVVTSGPLTGTGARGAPEVSARDADFSGLLNGIRRQDGKGSVSFNAQLNRAAQGHADDMVVQGYFSHTSLDGRTVGDRIRATGYKPKTWGENIAQGYSTNAAVMDAWQNSPPHNRLLLLDTVDEFGLGVAGNGANSRWVLVMAAD